MTTFKADDTVTLSDVPAIFLGDKGIPRGVVVDHVAAEMVPPEDGVVLVLWDWGRQGWEKATDLQVLSV